MARSITTIYDEIVAEMQTFSSLSDFQTNVHSAQTFLSALTTSSKVAIWKTFVWLVSFAIWVHEVLFDKHKEEVEQRAQEIISGTALWYRDQCLLFQLGDVLLWINNKFQYNAIDVSKQIIKRAAVIEGAGQVRLKVAKLDGSNLPIPLTLSELNAFQNYINKIKFAGTDITITSRTSDLLKLQMDVFYDPLVIDANGMLINNPAIKPVEIAINDFISNLSFNGKLVLTSLVDAVQQVNGVNNPVLLSAEAKFGQLPYAPINVDYIADAGHLKIDAAFPLSTTINYIADV